MNGDPLRLAPSGTAPKRLVVLLHGYDSEGAAMMPFAEHWRMLLPDAAFWAPDGPLEAEGGTGRCWSPLRSPRDSRMAAEIAEAGRAVDNLCSEDLARLGLGLGSLALVGFSQGALVALHAGISGGTFPAAILGFGGGLVGRALLAGSVRARPPVLLVNGTHDSLAPASALGPAIDGLRDLGLLAEGLAVPGLGHEIDLRAADAGGRFLVSAFAYADRAGR